ncbi:uncharacterized protein mslnb isoform X11 [Xiphophorus hellerii]|uniref:uncharacterized protein mslnb isoform X11 n=1 Tax=Xiphophorus hellerii TaxID=8084 RepID=UPI0013B36B5A|nr:uncharacterized protein LOC116719708 isoform X11 [Xiphophorus hellerii]
MKSRYLFLLVYLVGATTGNSRAQGTTTCGPESCGQEADATSRFLQCVGLPSTDTGKDHMQRLKVMLEATMDVYTFMKSSMTGVPVLSLEGALNFNPGADPLQNEALVQMWLEVKIKPLLGSITKHFLSCLSTKNFSCSTYQTVVGELSQYFSEMNPVRQKWIYTFFMYPFLSGERVTGCVNGNESSEEWLMKNFGAFRAMARMKDFTSLNMVFSGLEVLHLLSPAQKAELLLKPEVAGLDNGTLTLVFNSLLPGQQTTPSPGNSSVVPVGYSSPHSTLKEIANGFMTAFRPIGSFAHEFVSFTRQRNVSEIKSTTLTQFLLNWTLAELADVYEPPMVPDIPEFDVTNVDDWYQQVVLPLLRRFLPNDENLMHQNITLAFQELYFLEHGGENEYDELQDVCSVTLDKSPCGLTDAVENVAHIMHCAAKSELTMTEETIMRLITELAERLHLLIKEFTTTNFAGLSSDIKEIFNENEPPTLTQHHLDDPEFIKLWYQIKLLPLLPDVNPDLLSCLSTKNFSCPVYQTLVAALGESMRQMDADMMYSHNIYRYFIYSFLNHNATEPQCISSANQSAEWVNLNFGFFSSFASVIDFYQLNPNFSALEALQVLTPKQLAEMLLLPLPGPTDKDTVINAVFDFLLESPEDRKFTDVLHFVVQLAEEANPPCSVYQLIFERMYGALTMIPPDLEPVIWARIDDLMGIAPAECVPAEVTCQDTQINSTLICQSINSSVLQSYLNDHAPVSCSFTLEEYACAQLEDFTAEQLASLMRCNLPGNGSHSRVLWKLLLKKLSSVLNPALDMLANTSVGMIPSAEEILDVIEEIRLSALTDGELTDSGVIHLWFTERLSVFLPFASGRFLLCLTSRNLSCPSYQQILQVFVGHVEDMPFQQQLVVLKDFILRFLLNAHSGPGCLSSFNNSAQWLTDNFGPFSQFVIISDLIRLNPYFKPLEALHLLTPNQTAELLGLTLPESTDAVINMIFDYMTEAPEERRFTEFLSSLVMISKTLNLSCSSYKTLFTRLDDAMETATSDLVSAITYTEVALFKRLPSDCIIYSGQCNVTMANETDICMGVNSTELQILLDRSTMAGRHCNFSVEEFACASLSGLTAGDLAAMLRCDRVSDSSGSKPAWKLLLSKASKVLDQALDLLSNTTLRPDHPSAPMILDSIRELRLLVVNMTVLNDPAFVQMWFGRRLRPFLPAVSNDFLSCLATESLDCSTYQYIVKTFSELQSVMLRERQLSVLTHFITGFLTTNNTADPRCLPSFNNSAQWLTDNFGPFSQFAIISDLIRLNPLFKPFDVIQLLTPDQRVELLGLTLPETKDVVINMLFDYMIVAPERSFVEFLLSFVRFTEMGSLFLSCPSYKTLFTRLDDAMATATSDLVSAITYTKVALFKRLPSDCIIYSGQCNETMTNETDICMGVNSTELQILLDRSTMAGRHCNFSVEEFACASLSGLTAGDLADMLGCDRVSDSSGSKAAWKLLLSKASKVLDQALDLLSNTTLRPDHPSAPMILDSIRELRLLVVNMTVLNDPAFVQMWFGRRLRPFLPAVSNDFLSCLATESLDCSTYQYIVKTFSELQSVMLRERQLSVLTHFITGFLTTNNTADPRCLPSFNNSAQWLTDNFGPFSQFAIISDLIRLNPLFKPFDVIQLLTPDQRVELLGLTLPETKDVVINMLFDYMIVAPERSFVEFLLSFVRFTEMGSLFLSCSSYKTLFTRLDDAMATATSDLVSAITYTKVALFKRLPSDCIIYSGQCNVTMANETDICMGVNSTELQILLDRSTMAGRHCNFSVEEFACASLSGLTAGDLAAMLRCDRVSDSSGSKPAWKLLLSKASKVLDQALDLLSNTTLRPDHPSAPMILDSIRELRLLVVNMTVLNDPAFVQMWFGRRLRPFLPAVSNDFLSCLATESLDCSTYQYIVKTFSELQSVMLRERQLSVLTHFITGFLTTNNTADPRCLPSFNNSAQWLTDNFGPFSQFAIISDLIRLNPLFKPFDVIQLLTPDQRVELLGLTLPENKDVVINMLFDYMIVAPERSFVEFLLTFVRFTEMGSLFLSCSSYKTLFTRLDDAMATATSDLVSAITYTKVALFKRLPSDCIIYSGQCNETMTNETDICMGVNSTELQILLDRSTMAGRHCNFSVEEFACASLSGLTAGDLADMLRCDRVSDSSGSKPAWKLLLSKASKVLDQALDLLSNTTLRPDHPSAPMILDSIRELRLLVVNMTVLNDPAFVQMWFGRRLRPFLPAVSNDFLSCLATESLDCSTYQYIVKTFSELQSVMLRERQLSVLTHFITGFLTTNNTADPRCLPSFNNSAQWLTDNFGPFSQFAIISDLIRLNPLFKPFDVIQLLTPDQRVELLGLTLPESTDAVINMLFDYMTEAPEERKFTEFLSSLVMFTKMLNLSCSSYKTLFTRLDITMATTSPDIVLAITNTELSLSKQLPLDCIIYSGQCNVTMANETDICMGVNSTELQILLDRSTMARRHCNFSVEEFACASLSGLTAGDLAAMLRCDRVSDSSGSKPAWKLLLSKASKVLDQALDLLSNTTLRPDHPSAPMILDSIRELRLLVVNMTVLNDPAFVQMWFGRRLRPFLPAVSDDFLSCLATESLDCSTYQYIVKTFSELQSVMLRERQLSVLTHFITGFLTTNNTADPRCLPSFNNSAQWLTDNFGPFSQFAIISDLIRLNPLFKPFDVIQLLTPDQRVELLGLTLPESTDAVINMLFDYMTEAPEERKFTEFLSSLVMFTKMLNLSCSSYKTLFTRLDDAMATATSDLVSAITYTKVALFKRLPSDCIIYSGQCNETMTNETDICMGVNSTELQILLDRSTMAGRHCNFSVEEFACASLSGLTAGDLAAMLRCDRVSDSSGSKPAWKLLLSKASKVLDQALDLLSNTTLRPDHPSAPMILDSIRELRLLVVNMTVLNDPAFVQMWFGRRLRPFLPAVSNDFLSCLATESLDCSTYQYIVKTFSELQSVMLRERQLSVLTHFITGFLTTNNTADPRCLPSFNNSAQWLTDNFGPFSQFAIISDLIRLNPLFKPFDVIQLLTPDQRVELLGLTLPESTDAVINMLFDYMTEAPEERKFTEFLSSLVMFTKMLNLSCSSYKTLFTRLDITMATTSPDIVLAITNTKLSLSKQLPLDCIIYSGQCNVTMANETDICMGVNSTELQILLDRSTMAGRHCNFSVEEFACASLSGLTAGDLAAMLRCDRVSDSSGSKPAWKLLLSKASKVLDQALDLLSNTTLRPDHPSAPMILDSIRELRLLVVNMTVLNDPAFVQMWFGRRLRPFLPAVSNDFLSCLATESLDCSTYQYIVKTFSELQSVMLRERQLSVLTHFITGFLTTNNTADPRCLPSFNNSAQWLTDNFGPFSQFAIISDLIRLNPLFKPFDVIQLLTPDQRVELLGLTLPENKDVVINMLFDYMIVAPERSFVEFLLTFVRFTEMGSLFLSCSSYKTLFTRLDDAMATATSDLVSAITYTKVALFKRLPSDCIIYSGQCNETMTNETDICMGVNSTELQILLDRSTMAGRHCNFSVEEFACASLSGLTAGDLADMLRCDRVSDSSGSKPAWKLLLSKASKVLDQALDLLSNTTLRPDHPSAPMILDSIRELRLLVVNMTVLNDPAFVQMWFGRRLRPFLPAVSNDFLSCLATESLDCSTYQYIVKTFSELQSVMLRERQLSVLTHFITGFLTTNNTADPRCLPSFNNSAQWLTDNFGPFSQFAIISDLIRLNPLFKPFDVIQLLTPDQRVELLGLTLPESTDAVINMLFDYMTEAPEERRFTEFLSSLVMFTKMLNLSCSSYKTLFTRLDITMATTSPDIVLAITNTELSLSKQLPLDCIIYSGQCNVTMANETDICMGVNSTELQILLDRSTMARRHCNFSVEEFACASLSGLTAGDLAAMLRCDRVSDSSGSKPAWKLLLSKASKVLDQALDLLSNTTLRPDHPSAPMILDSIRELRLLVVNMTVLNDPAFVQMWFGRRLRPFLPAVSDDFLSCLATESLDCSTYQYIVKTFSELQSVMLRERQLSVLTHFITGFLTTNNTADPRCLPSFNNSAQWLTDNFGPFSQFAIISDLIRLNPLFKPFDVIQLLTPDQRVELLGLTLPESTDAVINMLFDYMTEAPEERKFTEFLSSLVMFTKMLNLSCSSYKTLFTRLDITMATTSPDIVLAITNTELSLSKQLPLDCIIYSGQCNVTMANETDICMGVNSTELQILLDRSTMAGRHCNFSVEEFACASLSGLTAGDLADMLRCDRVSDSSGSKPAWKLLLSKASKVLDQALDLLSNTTLRPDHPSAPMILDSIRELRLLVVNMTVLNDPAFVQMWFGRRLRPFLPAVSDDFLSCLSSKSLDCSTYHYIVKTFSELQSVMLRERQLSVLTHFITGFLTNNTAGPGCLSSFNNSAQWLTDNFGPFSQFVPISVLIRLNQLFKPLEVFQLLTPDQRVALLALTLPETKDVVINMLFDYMIVAPERSFVEFLLSFVRFTEMGSLFLSCPSYKTLFTRLDDAMATATSDLVSAITYTKVALFKRLPSDCIIYSGQCNETMTNETDICMGVNSTELQILLDRSTMAGRHCNFSVEEFACASLSGLTAGDLADMLRCDRVSDSSGSKPAWKLLLSKASKVLDQALDLLSNTTLRPDHPSAPMILDSIRELRLLVVNMTVLNDPAFVQMWFGRRLRPFLPAVSNDFLSCLATESLDCSTYQYIVKTFSELQSVMLRERQLSVLTHFITGFLTTNNTADPRCLPSFNNSAQWLTDNFGPFSQFAIISDLIRLNPLFKPFDVIQLLTPDQRVELLGLTLPESTDAVINMLFDYMTEAPEERRFTEFLSSLVMFTKMLNLSCSSYKTLFTRLDITMATTSPDIVLAITNTKLSLSKQLPLDCIIYSGQCNVTMANETDICMGVNSTELQILLDRSTMARRHCNFSVEEFACASLSGLTAGDLAAMLRCDRVSDSSGSKPAWKLLLSKASKVLDQALDLLSNTTLRPDHPSAPMILDSIRELRLLVVNMTVLNDPAFVQMWFGRRLRPFLPAVSDDFLSCLATESLDCSTYQYIVKTFSELQSVMLRERQLSVLTHFITGFLTTNNTADPRCLPSFNNSAQWLTDNFGPFSQFAIISDLIRLNPLFKPFDVIQLLTPDQRVELLGLTLPENKDVVINMLFDYMIVAPERSFVEFLLSFVRFTEMGSLFLSCSSYKTLFTRLDDAMATATSDLVSAITYTKVALFKRLPSDCIIYSGQCNETMTNETDICMGVNSTELQILLDRSTMAGRHCNFSVEEFACASLSGLTAGDLADMLGCDRVSDSSGSKPAWKLLLSKASKVLDQALDLLSNTTLRPDHPSAPMILDSIRELRLLIVNMTVLNDPAFVQMWFGRRLRPFLPAVSNDFLSCLATESLDCSTYQYIVKTFSELQSVMLRERQLSVLTHFITGFLTTNNTADPRCLPSFNNSAQWLTDNFGPFSQFAIISDLIRLNPLFKPFDVIQLLTPDQRVELLGLTLPESTDAVINMLFDYMTEAPEERKFTEFLSSLVMFTKMLNLSCSSYKTLFTRLDITMATTSPDIVLAITNTELSLSKQLPLDCIIYSGQCNVTMANETDICMGVNSTELQILLDRSTMARRHCNFSVEEFACASLSGLTAGDLADMLRCDRVSDSSGSKAAWKLLLSKASKVLDQALDLLSNTTLRPDHPSAPMILDSIRELRLLVVNMTVLNDPAFVQMWFGRRLRPFLPAVSNDFLSCLATESLDCSTYQYIVKTFSELQSVMLRERQLSVLTHFITGFLTTNNTADPRCLPSFNNSAQWLTDNFGPFSQFAIISDLIRLNPLFKPFDVIQLLTPDQRVELLGLTLPESTDAVINMLFDYMTEAPEERKFTEFLSSLVMFTKMLNLSCSSYKTLFTRLDITMATTSPDIVLAITNTKLSLSKQLPLDCIIYSGQCNVTMANETDICMGVNSTELQILLDRSTMARRHCNFSVEEFACASLSGLTAGDLADMLRCDRVSDSSGSKAAWKLLLSKASKVLDQALDLLSNTTLRPDHPSAPMILDSIRELRLLVVNMTVLNDPAFVQMWFGRRLRPFLPAVSNDFLSCLATESLDCSTYQYIVKTFSELQSVMLRERQLSVLTHFITGFLTTNNTADPACSSNTVSSGNWLQKNLGGFSVFLSIQELQKLYPNFSPMEALASLSVGQLVALSATPGLLTTPDQVAMVMKYVPDQMLAIFFDEFSVAIRGNEYMMPSAVRSAMLEVVFDRANLSHPSVEDSVVSVWLNNRLPPLVISLIPSQVNPYFQILVGRNCSIGHQGVTLLNSTIPTLTADSQKEIYNQIVLALKGPPALRCYGDGSFYRFVEDSFLGFQFPNLTTFLSLMPRDQKHLLVNSMPLSHLGNLLRRPGVVDNGAQLCDLYSSYAQTPAFLETESLPVDVRRPTLPCVWPMALSSTRRSEVNAWFDRSLQNYLVFLSKSLISPDVTHNTSCLAFQKLVSVLGQYNYTAVDFVQEDVFNTIRNYLQSATPRCYDPNNPELNSTAWFAEYIGPFMPFLTLEIFHTFGSDKSLQVFTVNPLNIALLNHSVLPQNLTNYYTGLVYQQDSNFNPLLLPLLCRCVAPGMAFTQLTPADSLIVLQNLTIVCQDLNPQISAALTSNFGNNIDSNTISALGNESTTMSTGQIKAINPQQLINALFTLSNVNGWKAGQAKSIIESLMTVMQINDSSSLFTLGTLIIGVPSRVFRKIQGSEILVASRNPSLVGHMMSAPNIVQQIFVTQILSVNSTGEAIIQNVPDEMATEIPRFFLQSFTAGSITKLNKKKWKRQQAEVFFGVIAVENATAVLGGVDNLSSSVLQGFTCTSVRTIEKEQVKKLVKACRRKGTDKVKLVESQLTCMFNRIRGEADITSFDLFPPDVLLYYDYSLVPQSNCSFYFKQLSDADFSVFSSELSYKRTALFDNARNCLGITTTNLTKAQITVLGNMCCYLNASYILNSDESILEKLKTCPDLSADQATAVKTRLTGGTSRYRLASTWTETTLRNLDTFPLYMSSDFYDNFDKTTKRSFLNYYLKVLSTNGVSRAKIGAMKAEIRQSISSRLKRQTVTECTAGVITKVTIYNGTFPFDYPDVNQFNSCLSAAVVRDNLEVITQKLHQQDYLKIVLSKLQEAYSTTVPEDQVQVLGPAARVASADQINTWNITQVDTLASLMNTTNGELDPSLAKAIISKYLSVEGNKLETAELNAIGGPNLCSVNTEVLGNISQKSLRDANALNVSICTSDKLKVLFNIALLAFQTTTRASVALYQFIQPYLGGAPIEFVKSLASSNINMDLQTFVKLDESVVQSLLVGEVKTLLGDNLPDLKSYENTPIVRSWISKQLQSELDTLNIELTGGRADSSVSTNSTSSATTPSATTTTTVTTVKTTKGAGARIHGDVAGFTFFVFLALLVSSNQVSI